jgi:hypothetical protein
MKIDWFGWLTKGHCEVTGADKVIASLEVLGVGLVVMIVWFLIDQRKQRQRIKRMSS